MTEELRAEIVMPRQRTRRGWPSRVIAIGLGCGVLGSVLAFVGAMTLMSERSSNVTIAPPDEESVPMTAVAIPAPPVVIQPLVVPAPEVSLVFSAGGDTYVQLTASELPLHGKPRLLTEDGIQIAIARVAVKNLPLALRNWNGRKVKVDNTCEAKVTGFAVVARLTGMPMTDTGYEEWTAESVFESGGQVLAARLDGCPGNYARDAALPNVVVLEDTDGASEELVDQARAIVLASPLAVEAQRAWEDHDEDGNWYEGAHATIMTRVVRNPVFGTTLVSVQVYRFGDCGEPGGNIWGLFLVERDGKLATLQLRSIGMPHIDQILDLEGDGEVELLGTSRLHTTIERENGDDVDSLTVAETGCGC